MASRTPDSPLGTNKRRGSPSQAFPRRAGKTLRAAIDEFLLDRQSQKYSPKTLKWHTQALAHLADFLEQQHGVTHLWMIESVQLPRFRPKRWGVDMNPARM